MIVTAKEALALQLLADNPRGLYGSDLLSNGKLGRGTVYSILERLVAMGYVREVEEPPTVELRLSRTRHFLTETGKRARADHETQKAPQPPAFASAGAR